MEIEPMVMMVAFAAAGLGFGSFAAAAAWRIPRGIAVAAPRSACPACRTGLGMLDLVPVASWLLTQGRCRHCGSSISWRYPVVELATAGAFVICALAAPPVAACLLAATAFGLMILTITDLEAGIIPDKVLLGLAPVAVAWRAATDGNFIDMLTGGFAALACFWALRWLSRRLRGRPGLGLGDVKFAGVAGLYLGLPALSTFLMMSGLAGILMSLALRRSRIPFGPAMALALFGNLLLQPR